MIYPDDSVCLRMDLAYLEELLSCTDSILGLVDHETSRRLQPHLFKIAITVLALAQDESLKEDARESLKSLAKSSEVSMVQLYKRETGVQLSQLNKECAGWGHGSHRLKVFEALMTQAGSAVGYYPDLVVEIFQTTLARYYLCLKMVIS